MVPAVKTGHPFPAEYRRQCPPSSVGKGPVVYAHFDSRHGVCVESLWLCILLSIRHGTCCQNHGPSPHRVQKALPSMLSGWGKGPQFLPILTMGAKGQVESKWLCCLPSAFPPPPPPRSNVEVLPSALGLSFASRLNR